MAGGDSACAAAVHKARPCCTSLGTIVPEMYSSPAEHSAYGMPEVPAFWYHCSAAWPSTARPMPRAKQSPRYCCAAGMFFLTALSNYAQAAAGFAGRPQPSCSNSPSVNCASGLSAARRSNAGYALP